MAVGQGVDFQFLIQGRFSKNAYALGATTRKGGPEPVKPVTSEATKAYTNAVMTLANAQWRRFPMPRQPRLEAPGRSRPRMVRGKEEDNL